MIKEDNKEKQNQSITSQTNLILLHGLFGNLSNWQHVNSHFKHQYHIAIPQFPTQSVRENLDTWLNYLHHFIINNNLKNNILVGNSLGGHVALLYTLKYPENVSKLVLTGSSGLYENAFSGSFPKIKDYNYIKDRVGYTFYNKEVVTKNLVDDVFNKIQDTRVALSLISLAKNSQKANVANLLAKIKTPTLLIWGLQDKITPVKSAYEFYEKIPSAKLRILNHCGHVPMMEQPKLFNYYLNEFLNN